MTETNLAAALAAVQRKLPDVRKSETAHVRSDKGSYSYSYADLAAISKAVLPLLGENGLAWTTRPTMAGERFVLVYELLHVSGEKITGEYPLPAGGSAQTLGSAITYARRYTLCAVTGVAADDDDDGAAASKDTQTAPIKRERPARQAQQGIGYDAHDPGAIKRKSFARWTALGIKTHDDRVKFCRVATGRDDIDSTNDLSMAEWLKVDQAIEAALPKAEAS